MPSMARVDQPRVPLWTTSATILALPTAHTGSSRRLRRSLLPFLGVPPHG